MHHRLAGEVAGGALARADCAAAACMKPPQAPCAFAYNFFTPSDSDDNEPEPDEAENMSWDGTDDARWSRALASRLEAAERASRLAKPRRRPLGPSPLRKVYTAPPPTPPAPAQPASPACSTAATERPWLKRSLERPDRPATQEPSAMQLAALAEHVWLSSEPLDTGGHGAALCRHSASVAVMRDTCSADLTRACREPPAAMACA